jgi:hypothetical protein
MPMGAEADAPLPSGDAWTPAPSPSAQPVLRRTPGQVARERLVETWWPARVRRAVAIAAPLSFVFGAGLVVALRTILPPTPPDLRALWVQTAPPGATVAVDGARLAGQTPLLVDVRLSPGPVTLRLLQGAGPAVEHRVDVVAGARGIAVDRNLLSTGAVRVDSLPGGAEAFLAGSQVGKTPLVLPKVAVGAEQTLRLVRPGYQPVEVPLPAQRGAEHRVRVALALDGKPGALAVITDPPAQLFLDGVPFGDSGPQERPCPPGRHELELRLRPDLPPVKATIEVPAGGSARYFFSLR